MRRIVLPITLMLGVLATAAPAEAHVHRTEKNPHHDQELANGQNHPGFVFDGETGQYESCEGISEPANSGPAGYGLETAHHGPDQGTPGKADGCFALDGAAGPPSAPAQDNNPAIK